MKIRIKVNPDWTEFNQWCQDTKHGILSNHLTRKINCISIIQLKFDKSVKYLKYLKYFKLHYDHHDSLTYKVYIFFIVVNKLFVVWNSLKNFINFISITGRDRFPVSISLRLFIWPLNLSWEIICKLSLMNYFRTFSNQLIEKLKFQYIHPYLCVYRYFFAYLLEQQVNCCSFPNRKFQYINVIMFF